MSITSNKPYKIFDAAAAGHPLAMELFKQLSDSDSEGGEKLFATTNDWCVSQPGPQNFRNHRLYKPS